MRLHIATVVLAVAVVMALVPAVFIGQVQGKAVDVIGLSGDDTRHGIVTHYGAWRSAHGAHSALSAQNGKLDLLQEWNSSLVELSRYHIDTLVQTRFAHTTVDVEVRNKGLDGKRSITLPFAIPTDAMLTQFIVETDGKVFQAQPVLREQINVNSTSSSATITARDAESFDVTMDLVQGGVVSLRLEYEQLLKRQRGRYRNVQQIWPGTVVKDMRIGVRIKEVSDISSDVQHFVTTDLANGAVATVDAQELSQITTVTTAAQRATTGGVREVTVTLQPTDEQQRFLASKLFKQADQGFGGQFHVEYEVKRYNNAGDTVVRDGYFTHFFAPSGLMPSLPKYAIFLLDVSRSMLGRKMTQLQVALKSILGQLGEDDIFTVIEFSHRNDVWNMNTASRSDTCNAYGVGKVPEAQQYADRLISDDGNAVSDLLNGMRLSLECAKGGPTGFEPVMFVLTDGLSYEPTDQIIQTAAQLNTKGNAVLAASVLTLALGADANLDFLKELAARNGGSARQIYDSTDVASQLQDFYASIPSPVLMDVSIAFDKRQAMVTQKDFGAYFWGSELVVAGRLFANSDILTGTVTALGVGGKVSYPIKVTAQSEWQPERLRGVANSERLWAFLATSQQLDQALLDGNDSHAAEVATAMALEHSFVTMHTCLALDVVHPYSASTPAVPDDHTDLPPTPSSTATRTTTPGSTATAAPDSTPTSMTASPTPRHSPAPPTPTRNPAPPPGPPRPDYNGLRDIHNNIAIGSIDVTTLSVNGPLLQFNLR